MKKQKLLVFCSVILLIVSLSACSKPPGFTVGKWNQNTFENSWLNMKFDVPSDWQVATKEEIKELIGAGAEKMNIEGTSAEQLKAAAELKVIYSFVVSSPGFSAQLLYENLALSTGGTKLDETGYLGEVMKLLLPIADAQYKLINESSVQIANKKFRKMELSAFEGKLSQEYYVYKIGNFMVCIIVSYVSETKELKDDFMNNIKVLN